jgi:hypothetical protein
MAGADSCYWPGAPWPAPFASLASLDTWYVQADGSYGHYGADYVGLGGDIVGMIQMFSPAMLSAGSCRIQYPQKMMVNRESGPGTEAYGGQQTGFNELVFTIGVNQISVGRGGVTATRAFHF